MYALFTVQYLSNMKSIAKEDVGFVTLCFIPVHETLDGELDFQHNECETMWQYLKFEVLHIRKTKLFMGTEVKKISPQFLVVLSLHFSE